MYTEEALLKLSLVELVAIVLALQTAASVTAESHAEELKLKQEELDLTVKINDDLSAQVAKLEKNAPVVRIENKSGVSQETFKVKGHKFGFKKPRIEYKNQIITPDEVLASKELQAKLVAIKSGMIYEIAD